MTTNPTLPDGPRSEPAAWIDAAALQAAREIIALSESWTYAQRRAAIQVIIAREMMRSDRAAVERCYQVALEERCQRGTPWDLACTTIARKIIGLIGESHRAPIDVPIEPAGKLDREATPAAIPSSQRGTAPDDHDQGTPASTGPVVNEPFAATALTPAPLAACGGDETVRAALEDIARQHQTDEMCEAEVDGADFENAYDIIIGRAREALAHLRPSPPMAGEREAVAAAMIRCGLATGHGDTLESLLTEMEWQVQRLQGRASEVTRPHQKSHGEKP